MAEMLLVNPRHKRRRRVTRLRRNPRQMTAKQLKYFGPRKARRHRRSAALVASTPLRRGRRRHGSVRRARSRIRHNVASFRGFSPKSFLNDTLIPAGIGAGGALGVDLALGYFGSYLPASLQTGLPNAAVKLAGAIGIGMLAGAIGGKRMGEQAMAGAVVVTLYSVIKTQLQSAMPTLPLHGYRDMMGMGWVAPAMQVGSYVGSDHAYGGMGMYVGEKDSDYY